MHERCQEAAWPEQTPTPVPAPGHPRTAWQQYRVCSSGMVSLLCPLQFACLHASVSLGACTAWTWVFGFLGSATQPSVRVLLMQFVRECFSSKETLPPVVIGGAVQGLLANDASNVAGVSLFAAHMPGQCLLSQQLHLYPWLNACSRRHDCMTMHTISVCAVRSLLTLQANTVQEWNLCRSMLPAHPFHNSPLLTGTR